MQLALNYQDIETAHHRTMKIRFVAFGSVCHQRELGDTEDLASDVLDVRLPHRTIRIENADVKSVCKQR